MLDGSQTQIAFAPLDGAEVSAMEAESICQSFLTQSQLASASAEVRAEDLLQLPGHASTLAIRYLSVYRLISSIR
jgi:hypothetical protein